MFCVSLSTTPRVFPRTLLSLTVAREECEMVMAADLPKVVVALARSFSLITKLVERDILRRSNGPQNGPQGGAAIEFPEISTVLQDVTSTTPKVPSTAPRNPSGSDRTWFPRKETFPQEENPTAPSMPPDMWLSDTSTKFEPPTLNGMSPPIMLCDIVTWSDP